MKQAEKAGLVHDGLMHWADREPDRIALYVENETLTYKELASRSGRIASDIDRHLARRVGLCLPNGTAFIDSFFASIMAGCCVCVFDPTWPLNILRKLVSEHAPNIFIGTSDLLPIVIDDQLHILGYSENTLRDLILANHETAALRSQPSPDMPFLIGFTSGSSGKPKAFIRSHRTWIESFHCSALELGTCAEDVVVAPGPLSHGLSLYAVVEAISAGASVAIHRRFKAETVLKSIQDTKATVLVVVPTMLDVISECGIDLGQTNTSLTRVITAGSKLSPRLRKAVAHTFPNADIIEYYGASELSFISVAKGSENCPEESVGRPFSSVVIRVLDDSGKPVEIGQVGTIWIKSAMISTGYVGQVDGSGFRTHGSWATVGDLGHLDKEGFLYLDGREGSVITTAGYTVYPSAIETVLLSHSDISDVVVIGLPDSRWGEVIAAAVALKPNAEISETQLVEYCQQFLEPYACPRRWCFVQSLERTHSGKLKRSEIEALFQ